MTCSRTRAFTLVELLTSISVLVVLVVILTQTVNVVAEAWLAGKARVDNFSQARLVLSLIDRDVQSMLLRDDLGAFVDDNGDPACAFYTRMYGVEGDRRLSLVGYFADDLVNDPRLLRGDYGLNYDGNKDSRTLSLETTDSLPDLPNAVLQSQSVAEGIVGFRWQFLTRGGDLVDEYAFDFDDPENADNTHAVIISLAVIDERSLALAQTPDNTNLKRLVERLVADTPDDGQTYASQWEELIGSPELSAGMPVRIVQSLRVFERSIPLPLRQ